MIEKQGIINFRRYSSMNNTSVVLSDSLLCFVYTLRCIVGEVCCQIFLPSKI